MEAVHSRAFFQHCSTIEHGDLAHETISLIMVDNDHMQPRGTVGCVLKCNYMMVSPFFLFVH